MCPLNAFSFVVPPGISFPTQVVARELPVIFQSAPRGSSIGTRTLLSSRFAKLTTLVRSSSAEVASTSTPSTTTMSPPDVRLVNLRQEMEKAGIRALIIPSEDPHMSEYAPSHHERRAWISHFTGSAGTVVVTLDEALLWTDGRYFLQASTELGPDWTLMKHGTDGCPEIHEWLADNLPEDAAVGVDPFNHTIASGRTLLSHLEKKGKSLVSLPTNPVDVVWSDQPALPLDTLRIHPANWAGETVSEKLTRMRAEGEKKGAEALLVTDLSEVAWLLNLRGNDVDFNPVFVAYAIVTAEGATVYLDRRKLTPAVQQHLQQGGVEVKPYDTITQDVEALAASGKKIMADPAKASMALEQAARKGYERYATNGEPSASKKQKTTTTTTTTTTSSAAPVFVEGPSPVTAAKALKNEREKAGMREAHERDGVALAQFWCWLEKTVVQEKRGVTEVELSEKLEGFRAAQAEFIEPSFPTIAGEGPNGAIIHYRPVVGPNNRTVTHESMLLLDSGGQYDCGTTDITRTHHFGTPTPYQREAYTRVLQGHIALDTLVFPEKVPGMAIDAFARAALWKAGLNYRHGTGHGVGAALNVHEGPMGIAPRWGNTTGLKADMIVSNEPGFYEDNGFGIRIENLALIKEKETTHQFGGDKYLGFEYITLCPIQTKMMDTTIMSQEEVDWVNQYHKTVWERISPRLQDPETQQWLKDNTKPIRK